MFHRSFIYLYSYQVICVYCAHTGVSSVYRPDSRSSSQSSTSTVILKQRVSRSTTPTNTSHLQAYKSHSQKSVGKFHYQLPITTNKNSGEWDISDFSSMSARSRLLSNFLHPQTSASYIAQLCLLIITQCTVQVSSKVISLLVACALLLWELMHATRVNCILGKRTTHIVL